MRLLLVEDDPVIASQITTLLERDGYQVRTEGDGRRGFSEAIDETYGLIVLDVMLPGLNGWEICERLRKAKIGTPILMLTARDSIDDRVRGLEGGADDYLSKPFDARELLARIKALIRRDHVHKTGKIIISDLELDSQAHTATRAGRPLNLTPREFALLEALARNEGRTLTREVILERVWDNEDALENTVNFHVTTLRKKLDSWHDVKLIHTVHGIGYVLRSPSRES